MMETESSLNSLDRTQLSIVPLASEGDDRQYWLRRSPMERLEALEQLRQVTYGYDPATARLQRLLEVAPLGAG
jgi:hypothetical protein